MIQQPHSGSLTQEEQMENFNLKKKKNNNLVISPPAAWWTLNFNEMNENKREKKVYLNSSGCQTDAPQTAKWDDAVRQDESNTEPEGRVMQQE